MAEFPAQVFRMDGDAGAVRASAVKWESFGTAATDSARQITNIDTSLFVGPESDLFREGLNRDMPPHLRITGEAFGTVARALDAFAGTLVGLQGRMRPLANRAPALWQALQAAQGRAERAKTADDKHQRDLKAQQNDPATADDTAQPAPYQSDAGPAAAAFSAARREWQTCVNAANSLRGELNTAVATSVREIRAAKGMRFKENPKWYDIKGQFTDFVRDNKDLLKKLSGALKIISLVAGLLSFIPILAPICGPIAIGSALLASAIDLSIYAATGEGSLKTILIDVGLNLLPGVGKLARLGMNSLRGSLTVARAFSRAGSLLNRAGTPMRAALSRVSSLSDRAMPFLRRTTAADPIDVASGDVIQSQTDITLPGDLPLLLSRVHISSYSSGNWFGTSWASTLDQRLEVDQHGVCFASADGMLLAFPAPGKEPVPPLVGPAFALSQTPTGYLVTEPGTGRSLHFMSLGDPAVALLTAITNRNGHRIDIAYDADGAPTELRHSGGYRVAIDINAGRVTALRVLGSQQGDLPEMRFGYNGAGDLTEVVNSSGQPMRFGYDPAGRLVDWTDRNGQHYGYSYDEQGRCVRTEGTGDALTCVMAYDVDGPRTTVTDSLGHTTTYQLDAEGKVVERIDPLGHATRYEWDGDRKTVQIDPLGRTTRFQYDEQRNLVTVVRPDGSISSAVFDPLGQPTEMVGYDGASWRRAYDEHGNLLSVMDPAGALTRFTRAEDGRHTVVIDPLGHATTVVADAAGLPIAVTDQAGATTLYQRDAAGRIVTVTDPVAGTTRFAYTPEGKLRIRIMPDGATDRWEYDAEGNAVAHTDPAGFTTRTEIGAFDQPVARLAADGSRQGFAYDTELRLVAVTNPHGLVWRYEYDPAGRLLSETDFNGRTLRYEHDPAGQLVSRTNGCDQTTRYTRDSLGRVIAYESADGVSRLGYDNAGRLVRATNEDADLVIERDGLGRVVAEVSNGRTVRSDYDPLGQRVRRLTPGAAESRWDYGPTGTLAALHTAGESMRFSYDAAGRETLRTFGDSVSLAQTWDVNHRLSGQSLTAGHSPVQHRGYGYRTDGLLDQVADQLAGDRGLELDPVGRVTAVRGEGWSEQYAYDATGRMAHAEWPDDNTTARGDREYDGTLLRRAGQMRYEHDADGRTVLREDTSAGRSWRYAWTAEGRLASVVTPDGERWRYRYDALGRRIAKERWGGERVEFVWDGNLLAEEIREDEVRSWEWAPGTFVPLSQTTRRRTTHQSSTDQTGADQTEVDEAFRAIVADLTGRPTELVTATGAVTWRSNASLWGAEPDSSFPLRFPGQYHDDETGLHYNYQRYYEPTTARYQSADLLGLAPAPDPHGYVANPTFAADPLGLSPYSASTRVGRWMNQTEHEAMVNTGLVQEGVGGMTRVARPASPDAYGPSAPGGDRYVEFDVPTDVLRPGGTEGWAIIAGPNSMYARLAERQGLPIPQFPEAKNIEWLFTKGLPPW